jgi:protein-tyrosine phosphatase
LDGGGLGWGWCEFPIPDFGVPEPSRWSELAALARHAAGELRAGRTLLIHCAGGIGRTGILAIAVQVVLDVSLEEAYRLAREAGAGPQTREQQDLVSHLAEQLCEAP